MDRQVLTIEEFFDILSDATKNKQSQNVTLPIGCGCVDALYRCNYNHNLAGFQTLTVHYYADTTDYTPTKIIFIKVPVNSTISKSRLETLKKKIIKLTGYGE